MDDIRHTLNGLNSAWRERRFEELARFFDPDIVMKGPGLKELVRGRQALVQSYADFMERSSVVEYAESDHSTQAWGDTAAVTYNWTMTYEQKGETKRESGQDMFVLVRRDGHWVAVLRVMLF
ncbi:MAG TPA: nuclear transport factor 2 family protein [Candidatus Eremiobacteraceae bacterium]|nr:nuclear transport factor 2 family protein [Candidatus Eremiobacteraceae bacterium]